MNKILDYWRGKGFELRLVNGVLQVKAPPGASALDKLWLKRDRDHLVEALGPTRCDRCGRKTSDSLDQHKFEGQTPDKSTGAFHFFDYVLCRDCAEQIHDFILGHRLEGDR